MFKDLLTVTFATKRLEKDTADHYVFEDNLSGKLCALQPLSDEELVGAGSLAQAYKLFTEETDIKVSDKIVANGKEYTVKTVKYFNYGSEPHLEAIVSEEK